ncbi:MAG: hypothetical protein ABW220_12285, partial [Burkholderiaceae bacterium]
MSFLSRPMSRPMSLSATTSTAFSAVALAAALAAGAQAAPAAKAAAKPDHYTMADFARVQKIDAHVHLHNADPAFVLAARKLGFKLLTINVDYPDFPPIDDQERVAIKLHQAYPRDLAFAATFSVDGSDQPGWLDATRQRIDTAVKAGAVGVKVWKNIGMTLKNPDGSLVMIDDKRFAPVFDHLAQRGIPLLAHQ